MTKLKKGDVRILISSKGLAMEFWIIRRAGNEFCDYTWISRKNIDYEYSSNQDAQSLTVKLESE